MAASQKRPRSQPATDSPWFWLFLFGSVGLLLLWVVEPKFAVRQERLERMQQARQRVAAHGTAQQPDRVADQRWERDAFRRRPLRWLVLFLAALLFAAMLWYATVRLWRATRADREPPRDDTTRIRPPSSHPGSTAKDGER